MAFSMMPTLKYSPMIVLGDRHLRRILASYVNYYHSARTHLSLYKDASRSCSKTSRTARFRTSGEYLVDLFIVPSSQEMEPPDYRAEGGMITGTRESGSVPGRYLPMFTILLRHNQCCIIRQRWSLRSSEMPPAAEVHGE